MDPEENFLLQMRGRKTMHVWDRADRSVLSELELERFFTGAHRNLGTVDELPAQARAASSSRPGGACTCR